MGGYIAYFLGGFAGAWLILFMWGFSAGPATPAPYYALIAAFVVWLGATPLSLYYPKPAAVLVLVSAAGSLVSGVVYASWRTVLSPVELALIVVAVVVVVRRSGERWWALAPRPRMKLRFVLALLPLVACSVLVNVPLVGRLILAGPPH